MTTEILRWTAYAQNMRFAAPEKIHNFLMSVFGLVVLKIQKKKKND
jgi:hypothetical protein